MLTFIPRTSWEEAEAEQRIYENDGELWGFFFFSTKQM